jgi:hypothetical protein
MALEYPPFTQQETFEFGLQALLNEVAAAADRARLAE